MFVGRVYKLWAPGCEKVYVGSTISTLIKRFAQHKAHFKLWQNGKKHYMGSVEIIKYEGAQIELLHEDEFENTHELRELERLWADKLSTTNVYRPTRTKADIKQDQKQADARYYERRRRRVLATQVQCSTCGQILRQDSMNRHRKAKHPINGTN